MMSDQDETPDFRLALFGDKVDKAEPAKDEEPAGDRAEGEEPTDEQAEGEQVSDEQREFLRRHGLTAEQLRDNPNQAEVALFTDNMAKRERDKVFFDRLHGKQGEPDE